MDIDSVKTSPFQSQEIACYNAQILYFYNIVNYADRLKSFLTYPFAEITRAKAEAAKRMRVVDFGVGDPDIPTPKNIQGALVAGLAAFEAHRYPSYAGEPELRQSIARYFLNNWKVKLDPETELLTLIGTKEGIAHLPLALLNPGDIGCYPDPGYPVYRAGIVFAGGKAVPLRLYPDLGWLPKLSEVPADAKLVWLNYPNNPTGAVADIEFFNAAIRFARENNLAICHDAPYTEVAFDGCNPPSIMQASGAKDVCIEFHSLSKTYNMTGWRIGMAVGNPELINALFRFKSNLDSGIPQAIQLAAITALTGSQEHIKERNLIYQKRRDKLVNALNEIGIKAKSPAAGFYIWTRVPDGYTSVSYTAELIDKAGVAVTPGTGYGSAGEGYIRLSITVPDGRLEEGIKRLMKLRK